MRPFVYPPALWAATDGLAVFRLTRLVNRDLITERPRQWAKRRLGLGVFDFLVCPWCISVYVAAGVVTLTATVPGLWVYPAAGLAFSAVAGLLSEH